MRHGTNWTTGHTVGVEFVVTTLESTPKKQAIKRTTEELRAKAAAAEQERTAAKAAGRSEVDPEAQARRERGRQLRGLAEQAHGANLDLGWALRNELSSVEIDMTVARLLVYGLLGADYDGSPYTQSGNRVAELATRGIRLVVVAAQASFQYEG